jgi:hypothetical protein
MKKSTWGACIIALALGIFSQITLAEMITIRQKPISAMMRSEAIIVDDPNFTHSDTYYFKINGTPYVCFQQQRPEITRLTPYTLTVNGGPSRVYCTSDVSQFNIGE